jgi:hypothetical protein
VNREDNERDLRFLGSSLLLGFYKSNHTIALWDIGTLSTERDEKGTRKLRQKSYKHQPERGEIRRSSGLSPPGATVTPDFPKETKCKPICMPGSSFMHIVT